LSKTFFFQQKLTFSVIPALQYKVSWKVSNNFRDTFFSFIISLSLSHEQPTNGLPSCNTSHILPPDHYHLSLISKQIREAITCTLDHCFKKLIYTNTHTHIYIYMYELFWYSAA